MKKKILFFLPTLNGGGAERVSVNLMKQLNRKLFDIYLVLVEETGEYLALIPSDIKVYSLESKKTLYSLFKLRQLIKELQPDIVYSTLYRSHVALFLSLIEIGKRPKTIMRMPNSPKSVIDNKEISRVMKYLLDKALKSSTKVIAQTPDMKEEIAFYHNIKVDKIDILINPLDKAFIDKSIEESINPFNNHYINVVASGRLMYQKGYDILIQAFKKVYERNNNFRLFILGGDYAGEQKKYENMVEALELKGVVNFLGFQKNPYIFYNNANLFVMSSRWEGLPNTILENLYLQKPIVATKCMPFMKNLIEHGQNGFLVEVENSEKLADAILSYEKLSNLGSFSFFNQGDLNSKFNI
ncbi:MAG TPA: glycosyltransferase [Arcobacter sp.]|nr:glycosyltransferase [Arcobacter sp.]